MNVVGTTCVVDEFLMLVVDDDATVSEILDNCVADIPKVRVKYVKEAEGIEKYELTQEKYAVIILDILFQKANKIEYLLDQVEEKWPDSIILILSHYEGELTNQQRKRVQGVINKAKLVLEPKILRNKLSEIIPGHRIGSERVAKEFVVRVEELEKKEEVELYRVTGYVLRKKDRYMEVDMMEQGQGQADEGVEETRKPQSVPRKVLLPYEMFEKDDLCGFGTPIVFRICRKGGEMIADVKLDDSADKPVAIAKQEQHFLDTLEKVDERGIREKRKDE
jgi:DNA-binding NarL/FixJ family response regulator